MTDISSIDNYDDAITYIESSDFTALDSATKVSQIEQLVNQLPTAAEGQTVLGYSGTINIQGSDPLFSYQIAEPVGAESGGAIATFDQTEAAMFLKSASVQTTLEGIQTESDLDTFNATMTSEISANLAASTTGPVKTITGFMEGTFSDQTGGVSVSSDYFQRELPDWLNSAAPTINGIPRQTLVDAFESQAGHSISTIDLTNPTDVNALIAVQNNYIAPKSINDVMMGLEIPVDSSGNPVIDDDTGKLQSVGVGDTYITDVAGGVTHDLDPALTGSQVGSVIDLSNGEIAALADGSEALSAAGVSAPVLDLVQASSSANTDVASGDLSSAGHDLAQILAEIENGGTPAGEEEVGNLAGRLALLVGQGASEALGAILGAASGLPAVAGLAGLEISIGENLGLIDPASMSTLVTNYSWALTNPSDVMKEAGMELGDEFHSLSAAITNALVPWHTAASQTSPLVIDLSSGHTGVTLTEFDAATTTTFFDITGNGFASQTAWTSGDTGFLVRDLNSDGKIDNVSEMFGSPSVDGFAQLAQLDSNHDLKIDASDAAWSTLEVWVDANGNGVTDPGELHSLASLGITSIDLAGVHDAATSIDGNEVSHTSTVTFGDGSTSAIDDVWFQYSTVNTIEDGDYNLDLGTLFLPDLRGYGTIPDLDIAMSQDSTLKSLVEDFAGSFTMASFADPATLNTDVSNILYEWAGVQDVDPASRGQNVNAQQLEFLEHLFGQAFTQDGFADPFYAGGQQIDMSWNTVLENFKDDLLIQVGAGSLFSSPVTYDPWTGTVTGTPVLSESAVENLVGNAPAAGPDNDAYWVGIAHFIDTIEGLDNLTTDETTWLNAAVSATDGSLTWSNIVAMADDTGSMIPANYIYGTNGDEVLTGTSLNDEITANDGADTLYGGAGNDMLYGDDGNDTLYGGDGNDIIHGGAGNDALYGEAGANTLYGEDGNDTLSGGPGGNTVYGGAGDDTYVYTAGADDFYSEAYNGTGGADKIVLPAGISSSDVAFYRVDSGGGAYNDLLIKFSGGGSIQIQDQFYSSSDAIETLVFNDTSTINLTTLTPTVLLDDGGAIYGGTSISANQIVLGGNGNDQITTGTGNDTLDGGDGNDLLTGGTGNDTYIASPGYDRISDVGGTDTIQIPTGYSIDDVTFSRHIGTYGPDNDLIINIRSLGEIQVENQFYSSTYAVENLYFVDGGSTVSLASQTIQTIGTSGNDALYGITSGVAGNWFDGRGGNDTIVNGIGNNTYVFEAGFGNDTVSSVYHSGTNILQFTGVDPANIVMWTTSTGSVHIEDTTNPSDSITVTAATTGSGTAETAIASYLQEIQFSDGTTWHMSDGLTLTATSSGGGLYGSPYDDTLIGSATTDFLYGNGGNNTLISGGGNDYMYGGSGDNTFEFSSGFSTSFVTAVANAGTNILHLAGIDPDNVIMWTDYNGYLHVEDTTNSSQFIEVYAGTTGSGSDESTIGQHLQEITFDSLYGTTWNLTGGLTLTAPNSGGVLLGTGYGDTLNGGTGGDTIYANAGNNTIYGGGGYDSINLGTGADTVLFKGATAETGIDTISNFSTAKGDKIDIADVISTYDPLTMDISHFVELTTSGSSTQLKVDTDGSGTSYTQIATIAGVTGLSLNDLISDGNLIVHHS